MTRAQGEGFCKRCGKPFQPGQGFCATCGLAIGANPTPPRSGASAARVGLGTVVLGGLLAILATWYFLPGIFDPQSGSLFGSKNRNSPLARAIGPRTLVDEETVIKEDQYLRFPVDLDSPSTLSLSVTLRTGPKFEVYAMDQEGSEEFGKAANSLLGGQFHHYPALSATVAKNKPLRKIGSLPAGHYVILLDNTDFGDVSPPMNFSDDAVRAHIKLTAE